MNMPMPIHATMIISVFLQAALKSQRIITPMPKTTCIESSLLLEVQHFRNTKEIYYALVLFKLSVITVLLGLFSILRAYMCDY